MIQVSQKLAFTFVCQTKSGPYNFQIFANTEQEARQQLIESLKEVVSDLESYRAGSKAN